MTKTCTKCNIEKPLTEFHKQKNGKYGVHSICKLCMKALQKVYREANKDKLKAYAKAHYETNKDKYRENNKAYREANSDKIREKAKAYREANKDKLRENNKAYREANKDKRKAYNKAYLEDNKDKIKAYKKAYREANKDKIKAYREANKDKIRENWKTYYQVNKDKITLRINEYVKQRKKEDPLYKLSHNTKTLISCSIKKKGYTKKSRTYQILGCTFEEFKEHIERQFTKGMTWDNQGEWHLDHIYPVSLAENEEELIKLNHYTNFQPLWAEDNLKKSNKIENGKQIKLL